MTNKVDLEKFTGQNDFNMWRIMIEALLITQGLGDAIDPVIKSEDTEASSSRTPKQMAEIDNKARSTIILSLGDSVIREVANEKTVARLWAKLEQLYMTKCLANKLYIKKKMFSLRMIKRPSLDEHIDEFNLISSETRPGSVQFEVESHEQEKTELVTEKDVESIADGFDDVQGVILALFTIQDMYLEQMDIKTTFLHGELQEEIVMEQPGGYVVSGNEDHVCLLKKSLYGLKQSPRDISDGKMIYLMLYVDDMLIAYHSIDEINHLKGLLSSKFDMKDLRAARKILGMEIIKDRRRKLMFLTQQSYVKKVKVLLRLCMHESKSVQTPLANHFKLSASQCPQIDAEKYKMASLPYSSAVGSLMYAMVLIRPDISHVVSLEGHKLVGYVDSDFPGDLDKMRSQTGFLFTLGGCTVNWKATLQNVVALSTTEVEYTAVAEAFKEAIWLKGMVLELGANQETVEVYCDSQSAIHLSKNQTHHERTKHIDIKLHFVRPEVSRGTVKMLKVHTDQNPTDILTKVVPSAKFNFYLSLAEIYTF
ncbi:hypothetical protein KPL70_023693 [Citrus sinensis]|nr:hypothetical protein KPL70_023693 [Citrus sinensis]